MEGAATFFRGDMLPTNENVVDFVLSISKSNFSLTAALKKGPLQFMRSGRKLMHAQCLSKLSSTDISYLSKNVAVS